MLAVVSSAWADDTPIYTFTPSANQNAGEYDATPSGKFYSTKKTEGSADAIKMDFNNTDSKYIRITLGGTYALAIGDKIKITMYQNGTSSPNNNYGIGIKTTATGDDIATLTIPTADGKTSHTYTYEVTSGSGLIGQSVFYLGRLNGNSVYFEGIVVTQGSAVVDTASPSITADLNDETPYAATLGSPLALTIAASHYTGLQWYTCDSDGSNANAISGATGATYNYTPTFSDYTVGTKYFKCIVTNTNATGDKTVTSKIAKVNISASNDVTVKSVQVVANGKYTASASGTAYTATIGGTMTASVTITPNEATAVVTCGGTTGAAGEAVVVSATAGTQLAFSVTAGDGTTTQNYTLDITKATDLEAANNAYYLAANTIVYGGQQIVGDDITMTFSTDATGTYSKASTDAYISGFDANFIAATGGNGINGTLTETSISGCWYKFTPTKNGLLTVGVVVNKDKYLSISKGTSATAITTGISYLANGNATFDASWKASAKVYGLVTIQVEADQDYYFTVTGGSKMGFYGFKFTPDASIQMNISSAKWASFSNSSEVAIPEGVTAYYASASNGSSVTLKEITGGYIPANTGVVVNASAAGVFHAVATSTSATLSGTNLLQPWTTAGEPDVVGTYYTLAVSGNNPVFKQSTGGTLAAGKAYLVIPSAARELTIDFGDATGIENIINAVEQNDGVVYDLQGRRVANPTKGIYIVNGKKVVIK